VTYYKSVPEVTIKRLLLYYRFLKILSKNKIEIICSSEIGKYLNIPSAQVRKDFSYFGGFGTKGLGYRVDNLLKALKEILGINKKLSAVIIGAGNLGNALINYDNFSKLGLTITHIFDIDLNIINKDIGNLKIKSIKEMPEIIKNNSIKIAIITVPGQSGQEVCDILVSSGIKTIWNFAPIKLNTPENIYVHNEDLIIGITSLIHDLSWKS